MREGLRLVRKAHSTISAAHRIIGTGKFRSGIPDLATNKKYLEGWVVEARAARYKRDRGHARC